MAYPTIKEKLISIVQEANDELLQLMYDTAEAYQHNEKNEWSEREITWLREQTELRKKGLVQGVSWMDAKTQIIERRKAMGK